MGLVAACVLALVIIGFAVYFLARMLSGGKQVANATDAGAINAAKEILAVTADINAINWPTGGVGHPPVEFTGLGVSYNDTTETNNGLPNPTLTQYNVMAYNRVAGVVLLEALNAVYAANQPGGDNGGIQNVNDNIANLQALGSALYTNIQNSAQPGSFPPAQSAKVAYAFQDVTGVENVNSAGASEPQLESNLNLGFIGTGSGATPQAGKANVYFANNTLPPTYSSMLSGLVDNNGGFSATPPTGFPSYAGPNQPLVYGYTPLQITGGDPGNYGSQLSKFYAVNANPNQFPHLIDLGRFNAETGALPGVVNNNVPPNGISGTTKTPINTFNGANVANNLFTTAIASAVMGSGSFSYPITFTHGYVRVRNDFDTAFNNSTGVNSFTGPINDPGANFTNNGVSGNSIFNNELYQGTGGSANGILYWTTTNPADPNPNQDVYPTTNNLVFTTAMISEPSGLQLGSDQVAEWVAYNTSYGNDFYHHDPAKDPTGGVLGNKGPYDPTLPVVTGTYNGSSTFNGQQVYYYDSSVGNPYTSNPWVPNDNLRTLNPESDTATSTPQPIDATVWDMYYIQAAAPGSNLCTQDNYDANEPAHLKPACDDNITAFITSYGRLTNPNLSGGGNPQSTPLGGLTNIEYIKGDVIDGYLNMGVYKPNWKVDIVGPYNPSGMRYWDEAGVESGNISYAQPSNDNGGNPITVEGGVNSMPVEPGGFAFGQNASPAALMNLITQNQGLGSLAGNGQCAGNLDLTNAGLWNNPTTIQGMLLQRCRQIWPSVQATDLYDPSNPSAGLLSQGRLDLGQALYIYYNPAVNPNGLTASTTAPSWASGQTANSSPLASSLLSNWGVQTGYHTMTPIPDGNQTSCGESQFTALVKTNPSQSGVVDAAIGFGNDHTKGDLDLHDQPFMSVNADVNTQDAVVFRASSGANGLLGDLVFQNRAGLGANASGGSGTFSAPN
jgi:hypothetical protein